MTIIEQIEVFFVDNANGWACARFDESGSQVGEAEYYFHRLDAIIGAKCMAGDAGCDTPIVVFRKDGSRGATL
jgi:hypothetical protein